MGAPALSPTAPTASQSEAMGAKRWGCGGSVKRLGAAAPFSSLRSDQMRQGNTRGSPRSDVARRRRLPV
jgi:hypothetical protein